MSSFLPKPDEKAGVRRSQEDVAQREEIVNWPRTTHDPFAGCWEEIVALVQAHPEWTATQIAQEIGHQMASHLVSSPMRTLIHRLNAIRASLRATWEEPWPTELIQGGAPEASENASPAHDQREDIVLDALHPEPISASQPDGSMGDLLCCKKKADLLE